LCPKQNPKREWQHSAAGMKRVRSKLPDLAKEEKSNMEEDLRQKDSRNSSKSGAKNLRGRDTGFWRREK